VDDTKIKVIEIVADKLANASTPEEMHEQFPHLSLAQIHAALAYYYDHKQELEAQIQADLREVQALREAAGEPPKAEQLRKLQNRK